MTPIPPIPNPHGVRYWEIVEKYPDTQAAKEAAEALESVTP